MKTYFGIPLLLILLYSQIVFADSQNIQRSNSLPDGKAGDSLPKGVSQEWLNDLRDENGEKIFNNESRETNHIPEDPETDGLQRKIFNGTNASSQFGYSVSTAGDVNGDGYEDIIVGAYGYNSNEGKVYIYYGGMNINTVVDLVLNGGTGYVFGFSVASAGDVNGDGFSDVIVGAYGYSSNTGRAFIYYGGSLMNNNVDVILTGEAANNQFGYSVSSAGDVNGDGYADVIVGANRYNTFTGRAYIYFGGASMNSVTDITLTGESINNTFGISVSGAGDVSGDGFSDVIVGANGFSSNTGRSYIFLGGSSMNNTADVVMTGEGVDNNFGVSVSAAGDVNGDGYSDVITGAYGYNSNTGRAYIHYGGASMDSTADVIMTGESTFNYFGNSVSLAGDVNGDGYSDVIAGAFGISSFTGKAYVYFGGTVMNNAIDFTMSGETPNSFFGISVSTAGDVNADGFSDVIAGANGYSSNTGRVYFYNYFLKNEIIPEVIVSGEASDNFFGNSVSDAGDVNGDGFSDLIVGAYGNNLFTGRAYIYFGGNNMNNVADVIMTGVAVDNLFGVSVSSAGDVNGDGYSDVIVGALGYNSETGRAYIFYGGSSMNNTADVIMTGESTFGRFGKSVSSAGDVNDDGYSDVIVGAFLKDKAYIYFGGSPMNNTADVIMTEQPGTNFGISVASAGDLNADGFPDVIIGTFIPGIGLAFIYYGGEVMDNAPDVVLSGEANSDFFGSAVSTAGDANGDGFSDVIIGADSYNSNTGKAYIFWGGEPMDVLPDVVMSGEVLGDYFANSVSLAGDVNRDGFSDVIVGADANNYSTGKAYIYFGGQAMNNLPDITMKGDPNSKFGISVSSAGDINADGYSDLLIGAYIFNSDAGRAYLYTGSAISVEPNILSVKDIPDDQGGYVNLKFARSAFDIPFSEIGGVNYQIERSLPPGISGFQWTSIATVFGTHNTIYNAEVHTPRDSGNSSNNVFYFRITAVSNSTSDIWRSNIRSGYSLDNISPPIVSPFNAFSESVNVRLTWKRNSAPDLLNYLLYRNALPSIDPYTSTPISTLTDSTYLDTSPLSGLYYYFIVAQDIHNNYSPVAVTQSPVSPKNLFLYGAIQGLYDAVSNIMIYDTVTVYLRNATTPFAKIDSSRKQMYGPGTGQEFLFNNVQNNVQYYVEVKHRNAIETWSADPVTFVSDYASIAFSVDAIYAYGNNQILVDTDPYNVFAFYSGDVNQDGVIDATDLSFIDNDAANFVTGYVNTDLTGDDFVDASDASIADNNAANFIAKIIP